VWVGSVTDSHPQGPAAQKASYHLYDLWQKDEQGKWGKDVGVAQGSIKNVKVRAHAVKVWKAVPAAANARRSIEEL
jgi:alpha-galactosidase